MAWFWYFVIYSFAGFLLEAFYARLRHEDPDRKCLLALPLCPVYGAGACAVLLAAPLAEGDPIRLFVLGAAVCTAIEYAAAVWYERGAGVSFWDYSGCAGNLHGRICLPFSLIWGALSLILAAGVHPAVARLVSVIPAAVTAAALPVLLLDMAVSARLLRRSGDRSCLRWRAVRRRVRS